MKSVTCDIPRKKAKSILNYWVKQKIQLFICTPCGILKPLIQEIEDRQKVKMFFVPNEDSGVAISAGFIMQGKESIVLMQNSGFGRCVNVLASLIQPYKIPTMLIISLRGIENDTTEENYLMGNLTSSILDDLGLAYRILDSENFMTDVKWAFEYKRKNKRSVALLIPPSFFNWTV